MPITIHVPGALRGYCNGAAELPSAASTVRLALDDLAARYPTLYRGICDETHSVRQHLNLFVNQEHIRDLDGLQTPLRDGDMLIILTAVSGG